MPQHNLSLWRLKLYLTVDLNALAKATLGAVDDGHPLEDVTQGWPLALIRAVRALIAER